MHLNIPHTLSQQEAVIRVEAAIAEAKEKMGDKGTIDEERWEDNTLHLDRKSVV